MPTGNGELGLKKSYRISMFVKIEGSEICGILQVHVAMPLALPFTFTLCRYSQTCI